MDNAPTAPPSPLPASPPVPTDALYRELYDELRRLARARLRRSEGVTLLDTTSLVHESWLRFRHVDAAALQGPGQFLAYASRVMRFVVIDFVRQRHAERRGGEQLHVTLNTEAADAATPADDEVLRIHEALEELARIDERLARVVEMRCFGGLDEQAIAEALGVTDRTVRRDWQKARLMLKAALQA
jgi:RNA polymerase sigma factor (TIGR02999 family)